MAKKPISADENVQPLERVENLQPLQNLIHFDDW